MNRWILVAVAVVLFIGVPAYVVLAVFHVGESGGLFLDEHQVPPWARVAPEQIAEAKKYGVPVAFENDLGMRFVLIPAGTFVMGYPRVDMEPAGNLAHRVTLTRPFYMQATEVTNQQFRMMRKRHTCPPERSGRTQPVVNVYWQDSADFAAWASARDPERDYALPTEAQWEKACRAGTTTLFAFGHTVTADDANIDDSFGFVDNTPGHMRFYKGTEINREHTLPVASLSPNRWGLYDMHGNVWEFCSDFLGPYPDADAIDPTGPEQGKGRVIRGGAVGCVPALAASPSRAAYRVDDRSDNAGFRLVSPLPERKGGE